MQSQVVLPLEWDSVEADRARVMFYHQIFIVWQFLWIGTKVAGFGMLHGHDFILTHA